MKPRGSLYKTLMVIGAMMIGNMLYKCDQASGNTREYADELYMLNSRPIAKSVMEGGAVGPPLDGHLVADPEASANANEAVGASSTPIGQLPEPDDPNSAYLSFEYSVEDPNYPFLNPMDEFDAVIAPHEPNVSDGLDLRDIRQPPDPPGFAFVKAYTTIDSNEYTTDWKEKVSKWRISLYSTMPGLNRIRLTNPEMLDKLEAAGYSAKLSYYNSDGKREAKFDLMEPGNDIIEWHSEETGYMGTLDLKITPCNGANMDFTGPVNTQDLGGFANGWGQNNDECYIDDCKLDDCDLNDDGVCDGADLGEFVGQWLADDCL